jgi:cytochrome b561
MGELFMALFRNLSFLWVISIKHKLLGIALLFLLLPAVCWSAEKDKKKQTQSEQPPLFLSTGPETAARK